MLDILAVLILGFSNPADPTGTTMYPSGIKDADQTFFNSPPATKQPVLHLQLAIIDSNESLIPTGLYECELDDLGGYIYLTQSKEVKAVLKLSSLFKTDKSKKIPVVYFKMLSTDSAEVICLEGEFKAVAVVKVVN